MGTFLQVVSGIYFVLVWVVVGLALVRTGTAPAGGLSTGYLILIALGMTLPAAALYAFGRMVNDTHEIKATLAQMLALLRDGR
jgi:hypothetical protein